MFRYICVSNHYVYIYTGVRPRNEQHHFADFLCPRLISSQGLRRSYARIILLAVTIIMFAISTAHLVITMLSFLIQWPYICATVAPDSFYAQLEWMNIAIDVMGRTQYFISDCVVVWRAWVIWYDKRWIRVFLLFSLLGTAGTCSVVKRNYWRTTYSSNLPSNWLVSRRSECSGDQV